MTFFGTKRRRLRRRRRFGGRGDGWQKQVELFRRINLALSADSRLQYSQLIEHLELLFESLWWEEMMMFVSYLSQRAMFLRIDTKSCLFIAYNLGRELDNNLLIILLMADF